MSAQPRFLPCPNHEPYVLDDGKVLATCRCRPALQWCGDRECGDPSHDARMSDESTIASYKVPGDREVLIGIIERYQAGFRLHHSPKYGWRWQCCTVHPDEDLTEAEGQFFDDEDLAR